MVSTRRPHRPCTRHNRLLTLTGPGGSGKTRLYIELASGTGRRDLLDLDFALVKMSHVVIDYLRYLLGRRAG